ncbi:MAG: DHHA1 domain-containing protein [Clostridia bacterium]|nr:DHHA1 domain-containing protein [Clostridia bacterium]
MTERLYYDDSYMKEFDAEVVRAELRNGRTIVALNQSAFYPTSGGQPYDTGTINDARVTDVFVDEGGEVWHEVDAPLEVGEKVHGRIDWARRWDHMQQHGGEHMIAGAVYALTGGMTIGLHLGAEVSSIDVQFADGSPHMDAETIARIEDYVNERIQQDAPIRCWFPDGSELASLPLRKAPTVKEHVRIVAMGDFEMVACGGTHPSSTGQIGLVKIVSAAPERGKLRLSFVCGMRAYRDYRQNYNCAWAAANLMSTRPEKLPELLEGTLQRLKDAERELNRLRRERLLESVPVLLEHAETLPGGGKLVCRLADCDPADLKELASKLIEADGVVALLGAKNGEKCNFVFARSANVDLQMGRLLSEAAKPLGGKGGGRPDFAQGGGPAEVLDVARAILMKGAVT